MRRGCLTGAGAMPSRAANEAPGPVAELPGPAPPLSQLRSAALSAARAKPPARRDFQDAISDFLRGWGMAYFFLGTSNFRSEAIHSVITFRSSAEPLYFFLCL